MKLNKREKILAGSVGGAGLLAVVIFVWQLGFAGEKSLADLQIENVKLTADVETNKKRYESAKRAAVKLDDWQRRALPSDAKSAYTLYQSWLHEVVKKSGFQKTKIVATNKPPHRGVGEEFSFTIDGEATLQQLTHFLYDFYDAGHLHKISLLKIIPQEKSNDLRLTITVDGFSLADADRRDKLTAEKGKRPQKKSYEEYGNTIVDRNIFAPPKPKATAQKREEAKPPPKFDHLEFTKLTAITEIDGQRKAWIETKTTGQKFTVHEGEEIDIASAKVKVLRIGVREIDLQIGSDHRTVGLGQNLLAKP